MATSGFVGYQTTFTGSSAPAQFEPGMQSTLTVNGVQRKINAFYNKVFLERFSKDALLDLFADFHKHKQNETEAIISRGYNRIYDSMTAGNSPIQNTLPEEETVLNKQRFTITETADYIEELGAWIPIAKRVNLLAIDSVLTEVTELMGEFATEIMEKYWFARLRERISSEIFLAGNAPTALYTTPTWIEGTDTDLTTASVDPAVVADVSRLPNAYDFRRIKIDFRNNSIRKFTRMLKSENKYATFPIKAAHMVITTPDMCDALEHTLGSTQHPVFSTEQYPNQTLVHENEEFAWNGFRFVSHNFLTTETGNSCTAHPLLIPSPHSYKLLSLRGTKAKTIEYVPPTKQLNDVYGHMGFLVWNAWSGVSVPQQERIKLMWGGL